MKQLLLLLAMICFATIGFGQKKTFKVNKIKRLNFEIQKAPGVSMEFKRLANTAFGTAPQGQDGEDPDKPKDPKEPDDPKDPKDPKDPEEPGGDEDDCNPPPCFGIIDPWTCECYPEIVDPWGVQSIATRLKAVQQLENLALKGQGGKIMADDVVINARKRHPGKSLEATYQRLLIYGNRTGQ